MCCQFYLRRWGFMLAFNLDTAAWELVHGRSRQGLLGSMSYYEHTTKLPVMAAKLVELLPDLFL